MAAVSTVQSTINAITAELGSHATKLSNIGSGMDNMRQQISDLLVGAGIPDSIAAQIDALLIAAQLDTAAINAALAKLATPLPPPTTGGVVLPIPIA